MAEAQGITLPPLEERPLVTFALFAYNQEKYIREAIEGAFAQTYEPLEIILSDDCSKDKTFELICEAVKSYNGPHRIKINRNEKNIGIGAHVNKVLKMAQGQWIVMAAGDDISLASRVSRTMDRALDKTRPVDCVTVELAEIDEFGIKTGHVRNRISTESRIGALKLAGAGLAYSRLTIDSFGDISSSVHNEDIVLSARALLLSDIGFVPDQLVLYRSHEINRPKKNRRFSHFGENWIKHKKIQIKRLKAVLKQIEKDSDGYEIEKIPDFKEITNRCKKSDILSNIIEHGYPNSFKDLASTISDFALMKAWIGVLIFKIIHEQ